MATVDLEEARRDLETGVAAGEAVGVSWLQRRYRISFGAATDLKARLCALGVVFPPLVGNYESCTDDPASPASGGRS